MGCLFSRICIHNNNKNININRIIEKQPLSTIQTLSTLQPIPPLPPELLNLLHHNTIEIQERFYNVLNRQVSDTEGIGFIYGFTKDNDNRWIKIGRTIQSNPNKRVTQWKGDILFCQKTLYNKKIETLIHLLLKNRNIHRMNSKTGAKEIEWFYFNENEEYVNVPKILAIVIEYVDYTITTPSHVA